MSKKLPKSHNSGYAPAKRAGGPAGVNQRSLGVMTGEASHVDGVAHLKSAKLTISELHISVPPPDVVKAYLASYPDAAEKFFEWSEAESFHRRKMDEKLIDSQIRDSLLGLVFGLIISLAALGFAAFAAWLDHPWVAGIIGGGTLVSLVQTFIHGRRFIHKRNGKKDASGVKKDA